jgi:hypothetical protein
LFSPRCHLFVAPRYFCFHHDAIFCRVTIFLFSPSRPFLLRHDTFVFTTMPSFVVPQYFCFHRDAIFCCTTIFMISPRRPFLLHHDILYLHETLSLAKR